MSGELSHLDGEGRARMVGVAGKPVTHRVCVARAELRMAAATLARISQGTIPKGDVFATARIAGIQAAKRAGEWIPLCHPLPIEGIELRLLPALMDAGGRVLTRDQLLDAIHGTGEGDVLDRSIDQYVRRLREKLGDDPADPRYVATVRGAGYRAAR